MIERLPVANPESLPEARTAFGITSLLGEVLPPVWLLNRVVYPVVEWDREVLGSRLARGSLPLLDRAEVMEDLEGMSPPVLTVQGFVMCGDLSRFRSALATLSLYGSTILAMRTATDWDSWECQVDGHWLIETGDLRPKVLHPGRPGRRPESRPTPVQSRLMVEQFFDVALRVEAAT